MDSPRWSRWLTAGLCCVAFTYMAAILRTHFGFPLDDSWIHQTVAENLAETGVLGYFRGVHGSGSSSLLWTVVLWLKWVALPKMNPVVYCAVLNGLFLGGCGYVLKKLTEDDGLTGLEGWILALAPALNGNFVWFGMLGMEHVLFVLMSLVVIAAFFSKGRSAAWTASIVQGVLTLTRPEGVVLGGFLLLFRRPAGRSWKDCGGLVLGSVAGMLISMRVNWVATHTLFPLTMKGRQFFYLDLGTSNLFAFHRLSQVPHWLGRVKDAWMLPPFTGSQRAGGGLIVALTLLMMLLAAVEIAWLIREHRWRMIAIVSWAALLILIYLAVLPTMGHGGRYQPIYVLMAVPLVFAGTYRCIRRIVERFDVANGNRLVSTSVAVLVVAASFYSLDTWRVVAGYGVDQINSEHGAMATWLEENIPAEGSGHLAAFDIGRIGYDIHGQLMDLGGLTDPRYLPYLHDGRVMDYLKMHGIQYVVLPTDPSPQEYLNKIFHQDNLDGMRQLKTFCHREPPWLFMVASPAMECQTVYQLIN